MMSSSLITRTMNVIATYNPGKGELNKLNMQGSGKEISDHDQNG